jgi:hypothetical protein
VDACLTAHVDSAARAAYLPQLRAAGITIVRERGPNPAMAELRAAGFRVVSFLGLGPLPDPQAGDALPNDLLDVYAAAKAMQQTHGRNVDVWEMVNEPDVGYCRDLPDRVAAFQKAVYLGIKSEGESESESDRRAEKGQRRNAEGEKRNAKSDLVPVSSFASESPMARRPPPRMPLVLMGALALPPGPWLERAARNGLLDYTDAYNFHFYGYAGDLAGVIRAHQATATKWIDLRGRKIATLHPLADACSHENHLESDYASERSSVPKFHLLAFPVWITECGINAVVPGDFLNPARRQLQVDFTLATARQAKASENVAVFMPFILVGKDIPEALTIAPDRPLPAWTAYASYARDNPFPARVLAMPPRDPNTVVVQWLPDNRTAIPHKVSGCYRFWQDQPMHGVLRIYNFGKKTVHGTLEADALPDVELGSPELYALVPATAKDPVRRAFQSSGLTIPALGRLELPVTFTPTTPGYFRDFWEAFFLDEHGRRSPVYFGLETMPDEDDFVTVPIELGPPGHGRINHPDLDGTAVTSESGAWKGINGAIVDEEGSDRPLSRNNTFKGRAASLHPALSPSMAGSGDPALQHSIEAKNAPPSRSQPSVPNSPPDTGAVAGPLRLRASVTKLNNDPLWPTMAIARVSGLPPRGFLRLQLDRPMGSDFRVRVDLVDRHGQRFTVWENLGASYFGPNDDVWLNLEDFHIYFWGRCSEHPVFRPQDVEEIRLRLYFARANDPRLIRLSFVQKRGGPEVGIQP